MNFSLFKKIYNWNKELERMSKLVGLPRKVGFYCYHVDIYNSLVFQLDFDLLLWYKSVFCLLKLLIKLWNIYQK